MAPRGKVTEADLRLIPEYDGNSAITEWLDKVELVCKMRGIKCQEEVIPLRLTAGAFTVFQQLSGDEKKEACKIREALTAAFAPDAFIAYEQFVGRTLMTGESVDVYLADLRRLSTLFGGVSDKALACAFVAGLPESVRQVLRAGSRMESMELGHLLVRARSVMADDGSTVAAVVQRTDGRPPKRKAPSCKDKDIIFERGSDSDFIRQETRRDKKALCYKCHGPNHFARHCLMKDNSRRQGKAQRLTTEEANGPSKPRLGNARGEGSAPASSPERL